MDCTVLGAGGMMPMPARLTTSMLLRTDGRMVMFDAGEGIQLALKKGGLGIRTLEIVAISHLHADHVLGLPGVLMFRSQCDDPSPLTIVGPPGIRRFIEHTLEDLRYHVSFALRFVEWAPGADSLALDWNGDHLYWEPLVHSTTCLGYRFQESDRPGKFDLERAVALGIPRGPLYGRLQSGETVTLQDGRVVRPADVLGPGRRGRSVVFATDTMPCGGMERLCAGADIAFLEGMFTLDHADEAKKKKHSTAAASAEIAARSGVKQLVLVHISPRYTFDDEKILAREAAVHFPEVRIGRGLDTWEVPLPD